MKFRASPDQEGGTMDNGLFDEIISRYSLPQAIVTDQGANFTGEIFKSLCKLLLVKNDSV